MNNEIEKTLDEREKDYGDFAATYNMSGKLYDDLLEALSEQVVSRTVIPQHWHNEALHMICVKLARLVCGNINHRDSWHDIAGYATLVVRELDKVNTGIELVNNKEGVDGWVEK